MRAPTKLEEFGAALALLRQEKPGGLTRRGLANHCKIQESTVVDWEAGRRIPSPQEFARIKYILKKIHAFRPLLEAHWRAQKDASLARDLARLDAEDDAPQLTHRMEEHLPPAEAPPPPVAAPAEWPNGHPHDADSFGAALRLAREHAGLSDHDLADLIGVSVSAVRKWEERQHMPVAVLRQQLLDLFPELVDAPSTNDGRMARSIAKPPGRANGTLVSPGRPLSEARTLGEAISSARRARGLTVRDAAAAAGVGFSQWYRWESGDCLPTLESYQRILAAMPELRGAPDHDAHGNRPAPLVIQRPAPPTSKPSDLSALGSRYALALAAAAEAEQRARESEQQIAQAHVRAAQIRQVAEAEAQAVIADSETRTKGAAEAVVAARAAAEQAKQDLHAAASAAANPNHDTGAR